jgi:uncharacterized membrane protein YuzA (DUF378 family)
MWSTLYSVAAYAVIGLGGVLTLYGIGSTFVRAWRGE